MQFLSHAQSRFLSGALTVPVDQMFPLEQAERAHDRMRENRNAGKIILIVDNEI